MSRGKSPRRGVTPKAPRSPAPRARAAAIAAPPLPLSHPALWLAAAAATACVIATVTFQLWDTDWWQHLVVGREIWRLHRVPNLELWTWPTHGAYDVTVSWAFRALLWPFWDRGGFTGVFVFKWLTTLAAFALLWASARRMGARGLLVFPLLAWAAVIYRQRTQLRPEMLVAVLLALQLWIHERRRAQVAGAAANAAGAAPVSGAFDATLALPLVAMAWANTHVSYWLGLALQAIYWLDAWWTARKPGAPPAPLARLAALGLASGAFSFVNPAGGRALAQPFEYWLVWRHEPLFRMISELSPVVWRENVRNGLALWVAGWPLVALLRLRRRGLDVAELLWLPLLLALALSAQRFIGFLALGGAPFFARDLDDALAALPRPRWSVAPWLRGAAAALGCVAVSLAEWREPQTHFGVGGRSEWYPIAACDFMQAHGVRGRGFNHFFLGGYLLWRFYPEPDRLPFMDIHQAGTREDRRLYAAATTTPDAWTELDRKYRFDWALMNRYRIEADRSLDILDADSTFALVFCDDNAALFVRRTGPMRAVADSFGYRVLVGGAARAGRLQAAAQDSLGRAQLAREIARNLAESAWSANALSLRANLLLLDRRWRDARDTLRLGLAIDPYLPNAGERLGFAALMLDHPREALDWVRFDHRHHGPPEATRELEQRARDRLAELTAHRAAVARTSGATAARRDTLAALDALLAPAARLVPARLPACR